MNKKISFLIVLFISFFCISNLHAESKKVEIKKKKTGYILSVDGKRTFVKGAVGHTRLDLVKKYGGNAVRSNSTQQAIDEAHE